MIRVSWALLFVLLPCMNACPCLVSRSACQEFEASNLVFIGTVESIRPKALDPAATAGDGSSALSSLTRDLTRATNESELKDLQTRALALLSDLPRTERKRLETAPSLRELQMQWTFLASQGTEIQFKVRTLFRQTQGSDEDADQDAKQKEGQLAGQKDPVTHLSVWNEAGDCSVPFERGETYLVYATDDEETDHVTTNVCHRTVRVSEAGDDLSYLFFAENGKANALRVEGFVTSDFNQFARLKSDPFHYTEAVPSPLANVIVEMKSSTELRHAAPEAGGRFVFDGLAPGSYSLSVLGPEFPNRVHVLSGPTPIRVEKGKCTIVPVLILSTGSQ